MKSTICILLLFVAIFSFSQTKPSAAKTKSTSSAISHLPPDVEIWTVDAQRGKCDGNASGECLLVKTQGKKEFEFFYDTIRGFDYQEGSVYVIWVKKTSKTPPVSVNSSVFDYELVKVVSKKEIQGFSNTFNEKKSTIKAGTEDQTKKLVVNEQMVPCSGQADDKCLLVKKEGAKEFEIFYREIKGFNFEEGFRQTILVKESFLQDPVSSQMQPVYTLLSVISKEAVKIEKEEQASSSKSWIHGQTPLDKKWFVRKIKDSDTSSYAIDDNAISIEFYSIDNRFSGKGPCNEYFGGFKSDFTSSFQTSPIGSTKINCINMALEEVYFTLLQNADRYTIRDGKLIFYKGDRLLLIFE